MSKLQLHYTFQDGKIIMHTSTDGITRLTYIEPAYGDYHKALPLVALSGTIKDDIFNNPQLVTDEDTMRFILANTDRSEQGTVILDEHTVIPYYELEFTHTTYLIFPTVLLISNLTDKTDQFADMVLRHAIQGDHAHYVDQASEEALIKLCKTYVEVSNAYLDIKKNEIKNNPNLFNRNINRWLNAVPVDESDKYLDLYGYTKFDYHMFTSNKYLDILAIVATQYRYYTPTKHDRVYAVDIGDLEEIPTSRRHKNEPKNVLFQIKTDKISTTTQ